MPRAEVRVWSNTPWLLPRPSKRAHSEVLKPEAGASELCGLVRAQGEGEEEVRRPGLRRKGW